MAKSKRGGASDKNSYANYKASDRALKNKTRRLEKHKAAHPNDLSAPAKASGHTRKTPNSRGGWATAKQISRFGCWLAASPDDKSSDICKLPKYMKRVAGYIAFDRRDAPHVGPERKVKRK